MLDQSIMLLDQDKELITLTENYLKTCGFHKIYSFGNPSQSMEFVARWGIPDVIITDIILPEMSGIDFLAELAHVKKSLNAIIFTDHPEVLPRNCLYPLVLKEPRAFEHLIQMIMTSLIQR
jgi:DNA-binding NtrC family response regulator